MLELVPNFLNLLVFVDPLLPELVLELGLGFQLLSAHEFGGLLVFFGLLFHDLGLLVVLEDDLAHDVEFSLFLQLLMPIMHLLELHTDSVVRLTVFLLKEHLLVVVGPLDFAFEFMEQLGDPVNLIDGVLVVLLEPFIPELAHAVPPVQER